MAKVLPLAAALLLLACSLVLLRDDRDHSRAEGEMTTVTALPAGGASRPDEHSARGFDAFRPLPRGDRSPSTFTRSTISRSEIGRQLPSANQANQSSAVGHVLIPPAVRGMSDAQLRARMPEETRQRLIRYERELEEDGPEDQRYWCWGPDTPPEVVEAFLRVEAAAGLAAGPVRALATQFLGIGHWSLTATDGSGVGAQGRPVTVTWSIVPDGTPAPGDGVPDAPSNLRAWLHQLYPGGSPTGPAEEQPWFTYVQEAMNDLAAQSGLNMVYEPNDDGVGITNLTSGRGQLGVRGDIRISARDIDGNSGVLGFAYSPNYGDIVLESYDSFYNTTSSNSLRLVNVLTHEIGHALGLGHVCPVNQTKLMEPFVSTSYRGTRFDETYSLQRQYGDELEVHSGLHDNDTPANATPVAVLNGSPTTWQYLSIDDSTDVDYLAFTAAAGESVTVRVIPSDPIAPSDPDVDTYLEGAQNSDGSCSAGTPFDPTSQQDLTLEILDRDGATVLAIASSQPAGETEELVEVALPGAGTYFLRINGGSADASQLYELQAELANAAPAPLLQVASSRIIVESNSGANGAADPGETLLFGVTVTNAGTAGASNLAAALSGPAGFVSFDTNDGIASLSPGASTELSFVFSPGGSCGDTINLALDLTADGGFTDTASIPLVLGSISEAPLIEEGFDNSSSLPAGWTRSATGGGNPWVISSASTDTAPNAAFSAAVTSIGDAYLVSPARVLGAGGATLTFRHSFNLESSRDGAVLEAALDGGAWFDLVQSTSTVVSAGGYNGTISGGPPRSRSSLDGRPAWSGSSGGFVTTTLDLPAAWAGQAIQLRWRLAHNNGTAGTGWYVDSVNLSGAQLFTCDPFRPTVTLSASGNSLNEGDSSTVDLTLATALPLVSDLSVTPTLSGTADASDLVAPPSLTLPAGQVSTFASISAAADAEAEGTEQVTLAVPPSDPGFAAGSPSSVTVDIIEGALTASVTLSGLTTTYNGTAQQVSVSTNPAGLAVLVTYDGSPTPPTGAGSYPVLATITEPNYTGTAAGTFVIGPAAATITLGALTTTYDGTPRAVTATPDPAYLPVSVSYDGFSTPPTDAGSYQVLATVTDPNYSGSATGSLVIAPAPATVTLGNLNATYDGNAQAASATTDPPGLAFTLTYDGSTTPPTDAGSYQVLATVIDPNYTGSATDSLVISPAAVNVTITDLEPLYDGQPKPVVVATSPADLDVSVTYDGGLNPPTAVGSYAVAATTTDPNYQGSAQATLTIQPSIISWRESFGFVDPDLTLDDDHDGWDRLAEYLFGTNPMDPTSVPRIEERLDETSYTLLVPPPLNRPDVTFVAERSSNLRDWTTDGITSGAGFFSIPRSTQRGYLRLKVSYTP